MRGRKAAHSNRANSRRAAAIADTARRRSASRRGGPMPAASRGAGDRLPAYPGGAQDSRAPARRRIPSAPRDASRRAGCAAASTRRSRRGGGRAGSAVSPDRNARDRWRASPCVRRRRLRRRAWRKGAAAPSLRQPPRCRGWRPGRSPVQYRAHRPQVYRQMHRLQANRPRVHLLRRRRRPRPRPPRRATWVVNWPAGPAAPAARRRPVATLRTCPEGGVSTGREDPRARRR